MYCPIFDSRKTFDSIQKRKIQKYVGFYVVSTCFFYFWTSVFLLMICNIKEFVLRAKPKK